MWTPCYPHHLGAERSERTCGELSRSVIPGPLTIATGVGRGRRVVAVHSIVISVCPVVATLHPLSLIVTTRRSNIIAGHVLRRVHAGDGIPNVGPPAMSMQVGVARSIDV